MMSDEQKLPAVFRKKLPPQLEKIKNGTYTPDHEDYYIHLYLNGVDLRVKEEGSDIVNFLKGKCILITGATGFIGKMLLEKLLRACQDIDTIYIIVRAKKGKDSQSRVKEFLDNMVFIKLAEIFPGFREKVVGISGDMELPELGLSEESKKLIAKRVNIIYNVAATVRFDEKLKKATSINLRGPLHLLKLAKTCSNLEVFTHMSTAFSNCCKKHIGEYVYDPIMDPDILLYMVEHLSDEQLDRMTESILGEMPNSYVFTKQLAEAAIKREASGIPVCIQRPSIVICSANEPVKGWIDNFMGPCGLCAGAALGVLHVFLADGKIKSDSVPADFVVNNCIAASYKTANDRLTSEVQVFNCTSSKNNQKTTLDILFFGSTAKEMGSTKIMWRYFMVFTTNMVVYRILFFLLHSVPAFIVDFIRLILGKKPLLSPIYQKIQSATKVLKYFQLNTWDFDYANSVALWNSLSPTDKCNFHFNLDDINWLEHSCIFLCAGRELLIHDYFDSLDAGRARYKLLNIIHYLLVGFLVLSTSYYLLNTIFCFIPLGLICIVCYYVLQSYLMKPDADAV